MHHLCDYKKKKWVIQFEGTVTGNTVEQGRLSRFYSHRCEAPPNFPALLNKT